MQVTETLAEGLRREFEVKVPASELDDRLVSRLSEMQGEVRIKGFRPGKVPVNHLRRLFGKSAMAEIVQKLISDVARDTMSERGERAAQQPDFNLPEDEGEAEKVLQGKADLTYTMTYEILPEVVLGDFKSIKVERPVADVSDEEIETEMNRLAENVRSFSPKEGKSESGDRLVISYLGKLDGEPFEGGADDNATVQIGSGQFIPGFAEQLEGMAVGDEKTISVTFPEEYGAAHLAGKDATFDVAVKEVSSPDPIKIDDELATRVGVESLDQLRDAIRQQLQNQYGMATRQKVKRQILDQLDALHTFELPPKMVEQEFDNIWRQVTSELAQSNRSFEDEDTTEEAARADYHKIAERRVRLGLVLSEIGEKNSIEVTEEEVQRALSAQLRQFPGREKELVEYYRANPEAIASLRAPIYEEKVVDFLLELVNVTDKTVSREELMREDEDEATKAG
ncbi:trigger factor [Bauldia litoralis]|uniref:Trigger factor n=1 Tax=Bauldia litoralis TaxID=665467 RepID=A0A1G6DB74_9HYPH|nr:trigger factor [Bauldia litoralis]SDB42115.1 trigger factor [Bauldia litoralis]